MTMQGKLIEYLDGGRIICATALEDNGKRLRLLNQNGREINLPISRVVSSSSTSHQTKLPREELTGRLKTISETRQNLTNAINLAEIWELASEESDNAFSPNFLAGLCFGEEASDDHIAAFLRAVFNDRLFFKYKAGLIIAHPPEIVEQNRQRLEKEKEKATVLSDGSLALARLWEGSDPGPWPERETCLELVRDYYLLGNNFPDHNTAKELLKRAGITGAHDPYHLLVKAGHWQENENIPLLRSEVPTSFSEAAMEQAAALTAPGLDDLATEGRKDFRNLPLLTIDGESTRDFDDALHIEKQGENYLVGIHISDVSCFIKPGSPLFEEARQRGTSLYFPEGALPMLPKTISEEICSLKAGEPRAAMSFMVLLSPAAEVLDLKLVSSLVSVKRQLTYTESDTLIDSDEELAALARLSKKLRDRRLADDALLLPFPDVNINIGKNGEISVKTSESDTPSRVLVSEFMILANTLGAQYLTDREVPGLFRSQPKPRQRLVYGLEKDLFINTRQRKKLSPMALLATPKPHSGIGAPQYTTVTSPIRRFLDLVVQHQLRHLILGRGVLFSREELLNFAAMITRALSGANAVKYLRHRYWLFKYLESKIGERFDGIIIDKGPRQIHVLLPDFMLDADLPANQAINAQPGDTIKVRIAKADALDNILRIEL